MEKHKYVKRLVCIAVVAGTGIGGTASVASAGARPEERAEVRVAAVEADGPHTSAVWAPGPARRAVGWTDMGYAHNVVGMTAINGKLWVATADNRLWARDPVQGEIGWTDMGYAYNVVGLTAINGKLWAATKDDRLWARDPVHGEIGWTDMGEAHNVVDMTAINGKLWAATREDRLWSRDPV
jgi:hypothetical protein